MNVSAWSPEERDEYEALLFEVISEARQSGERVRLMEAKMADATQAHRAWVQDANRDALRTGYASQIKSYLKRNRVALSHDGLILSRPRVIGTPKVTGEGKTFYEQALIELKTFDELRAKRSDYLAQIRAYDANVALIDKLLALADLAPGAGTPAEAALLLDIDIDEYLGGVEAA